ncbi:MAG: hypothetical protein E6G86_17550 [Alphaproteobacteria bacterium]|nr:MAG: hypothetical protein E6G86_17550 [Alphaproteobacteria bacterium]TMK01475.1 MAG: hypothetical protein E6G77_08035 [Alphaproteobacteria bacterium]TMK05047.1 MAG: hypothetical protein E6G74_02105 [Alphaproteobacteria bacterium]
MPRWTSQQARGEGESMPSLKRSILAAFDDFRASGLLRPAAEKFAGAWLACFLVMARGDILAGLSFEHIRLASICGIVGAAATVALLAQMNRMGDSLARQATISAVVTFIGDVFAHPSHFGPQWAEPLITAAVSAAIAVAVWHGKRLVKRLYRDAFVSNHMLASLPGQDPAIHPASKDFLRSRWMRGSSPRMTERGSDSN